MLNKIKNKLGVITIIPPPFPSPKIWFNFFLTLIVFSGCSTTKYAYRQIENDNDQINIHEFQCSKDALYKAIKDVLLTKKFQINKEDEPAGLIVASWFSTKGYNTVTVAIQATILSKTDSEQKLFLTAIQKVDRNYIADRTRFFLMLIPLPGGGGKEVSTAEISKLEINDKQFYDELFQAIQKSIA